MLEMQDILRLHGHQKKLESNWFRKTDVTGSFNRRKINGIKKG